MLFSDITTLSSIAIESFPQMGLALYPHREDTWGSKYQKDMGFIRNMVSYVIWFNIALAMYYGLNNKSFENIFILVLGLIMMMTALSLIRTIKDKYDADIYSLYLSGRLVVLYVLIMDIACSYLNIDTKYRMIKNITVANILILGGIYTFSQGRFCYSEYCKKIDYMGRLMYAFGLLIFGNMISIF